MKPPVGFHKEKRVPWRCIDFFTLLSAQMGKLKSSKKFRYLHSPWIRNSRVERRRRLYWKVNQENCLKNGINFRSINFHDSFRGEVRSAEESVKLVCSSRVPTLLPGPVISTGRNPLWEVRLASEIRRRLSVSTSILADPIPCRFPSALRRLVRLSNYLSARGWHNRFSVPLILLGRVSRVASVSFLRTAAGIKSKMA